MKHSEQDAGQLGFTLVELMLTISLGMLFLLWVLSVINKEFVFGHGMAQRLRNRGLQQRTLALIQSDLARGHHWQIEPPFSSLWPCSLAGRDPVLAIATTTNSSQVHGRAIVYSVGAAPSAIWRGQVLMRCGPAFDLNGEPNLSGRFQNRVVIDALPSYSKNGVHGFVARPDPSLPLLHLHLEQEFQRPGGKVQRIQSTAVS